jgi:hypothetical protein
MLRYYRGTIVWAACLTLTVSGCGKKDNAATVETASGAVANAPVSVTGVKVGRAIGPDKRLTDETDKFRPADVIYAVVETQGTAPSAALKARWTYQDGQLVDESSRSISAAGDDVTEFHISKPSGWPKGKYTVQVVLNGAPVQSKQFEVK